MAQPFGLINESTREEFLSGDFVRAQKYASSQLQSLLRDDSRNDDGRVLASGATDPAGVGTPIQGCSILPDFVPQGVFDANITAGQCFKEDGTGVTGLSNDDSTYQVVRWPDTVVTFATPDPANPRIDLVYVLVGSVLTDNQSRNILLDPVARTVAPASVPKKQNPQSGSGGAAVLVVTGTPAASPVAPALPAGGVAIMEVLIPAAAANSTSFWPCRRIFRRAAYPVSSAHGILQGCLFESSLVDETAASSVLTVGNPAESISRVIIDGEVITFSSGGTGAPAMIIQDAAGANPFAVAANANFDKPYYIYAVGGRHLPQAQRGFPFTAQPTIWPVCFVESLVAPNRDGRPSAVITTPRGTTQNAALFVGIGFVAAGTTNRKPCSYDGDWVLARTGQQAGPNGATDRIAAFNDLAARATAAAAVTNHTINTKPTPSTHARIGVLAVQTVGAVILAVGKPVGALVHAGVVINVPQDLQGWGTFEVDITSGSVSAGGVGGGFATLATRIFAVAYNMTTKRYVAGV